MPIKNVWKQSGTSSPPLENTTLAAGLVYDTADGFVKYDDSGTARVLVDTAKTQTISGTKTFSGAVTMSGTLAVTGALTTTATGALQSVTVAVTNAEFKAIRATPKELVAAPGAGFALIFDHAHITIDYTAAYTETADNMAIRYTDGSGVIVSTIEATGFVDATADSIMVAAPIAPTTAPVAVNAALVLHNTGDGEYGGGNSANAISVTTFYRKVAVP